MQCCYLHTASLIAIFESSFLVQKLIYEKNNSSSELNSKQETISILHPSGINLLPYICLIMSVFGIYTSCLFDSLL